MYLIELVSKAVKTYSKRLLIEFSILIIRYATVLGQEYILILGRFYDASKRQASKMKARLAVKLINY